VDQVLGGAGPVDAVTNQALACRRLLEAWGWKGGDFSGVIAPGMPRHLIRPLHEFSRSSGDLLLLHYSGYARGLTPVLNSRRRSLLIFHNITPARYFWDQDPAEAVRCQLGRTQLGEVARAVSALAAVSEFNAAELRELSGREVDVIPVLFDRAALGAEPAGADGASAPEGPPHILFVGRLVPHKRQDLVIRAFAEYRRSFAPDARLTLAGMPLSPEYGAVLGRLAEELAPGAVAFESGISAARLAELYRSAHVFLCLSEHEGFCIPVLEALQFGVPVVARAAGAVPEVLGDAGMLLTEDDGLAVVAELLHLVVTDDGALRAELRRRGERRLEAFAYEKTAARLRERLEALAA
jgi:glycosyltransferase involved in cell wall biosynthesis